MPYGKQYAQSKLKNRGFSLVPLHIYIKLQGKDILSMHLNHERKITRVSIKSYIIDFPRLVRATV